MYRLDMTQAKGWVDCVLGLVVNFGPISKLPYKSGSPPVDVFVGTSGGVGTIKVASAEQDGDVITFTFSSYVCPGSTTFFSGWRLTRRPCWSAPGCSASGARHTSQWTRAG